MTKTKITPQLKDTQDRILTLMLTFLEKHPDEIFWESFKSDEEMDEWINHAIQNELYKAADIIKQAKEKGLRHINGKKS